MAKFMVHCYPNPEDPSVQNRGYSTNNRSEGVSTRGSIKENGEKKAEESSREAIGPSAAHTGH